MKNERADLLARGDTDRYPDVAKLNEQIQQAEAQLAVANNLASPGKNDTAKSKPSLAEATGADVAFAQYQSQMEATRAEIKNAEAEEKGLQAQIADYTSRLNMTPVREQQLAGSKP